MSNKTQIPFHAESVKFIALSILHFFIFHFIDPFRKQKKGVDIGRFFEGNFPTLIAWLFAYYWALLIGVLGFGIWVYSRSDISIFLDMLYLTGMQVALGVFIYLIAGTYLVYLLVLVLVIFPRKILIELLQEHQKNSADYWLYTTVITLLLALGLDYLLQFFDIYITKMLFVGIFGTRFFGFVLINTVYANWDKKHPIHTPDMLLDDNFIP
jgi:hypothetical protein